jgi:hypothetical protein
VCNGFIEWVAYEFPTPVGVLNLKFVFNARLSRNLHLETPEICSLDAFEGPCGFEPVDEVLKEDGLQIAAEHEGDLLALDDRKAVL